MEYPRKNALSRHDAVTHLLEDCTALVAFLSDLRHLKNHIVAAESGSYRKVCKIKTFHYQIFPQRLHPQLPHLLHETPGSYHKITG